MASRQEQYIQKIRNELSSGSMPLTEQGKSLLGAALGLGKTGMPPMIHVAFVHNALREILSSPFSFNSPEAKQYEQKVSLVLGEDEGEFDFNEWYSEWYEQLTYPLENRWMTIFPAELYTVLHEMRERYFDIVWYARSTEPEGEEGRARIEEERPDDVKTLRECDDNWQHGFNSGMLAAIRFFLTANTDGLGQAFDDFPMLDT